MREQPCIVRAVLLYRYRMAADELFLKHLAAITKDFPPRGHRIDHVQVIDGNATLHVVPKPGFTGAPITLTIPVSDDWNVIFRALAAQRFMQRLFEPLPETHL